MTGPLVKQLLCWLCICQELTPGEPQGSRFLRHQEQGGPSSSRKAKEPGPGQAGGDPVESSSAEKHLAGDYKPRRDPVGIGKSVASRAGVILLLGPSEAHLERCPVSSSGSMV